MRLAIQLGLVGIVTLIFGAYLWKGLGLQSLTDATYSDLRGRGLVHDLVKLSEGTVHYRFEGPPNGEPVLLIHGFAVSMFVWDPIVKDLAAAGYHVLAYDAYGRGFSSRPAVVYDENLTDKLIAELLDRLAVREKVHVVGYSAGGIAAAVFAARHAEAVKSLSLIAPGGLLPTRPLPSWLFAIPGMKQWFGRVVAPGLLAKQFANTLIGLPDAERLLTLMKQQFDYVGTGEAMASLLQNYPLSGADGYYKLAGEKGIPILLLWGTADTTAPFRLSGIARQYLPDARVVEYPNAEHNIVYERPKVMSQELEGFFQRATLHRAGSTATPGGNDMPARHE